MYKGIYRVRFANFISFYHMNMKLFDLTETNFFNFNRIFKNRGGERGFS